MNLRYGNTDFCVDALGGTKFTNHGSYFGLYPCRTNGFNQELTHTKIGTLELTEFPGNLCMTVKNGLLAEGSHIVGAPCTGHGGLLDSVDGYLTVAPLAALIMLMHKWGYVAWP